MAENGNPRRAGAEALALRPEVDVVPTAPEEPDLAASRRARRLRRLFMTLLAGFVLFGMTGGLGVKSRSTTVSGGGYDLTVTYARVTRPGLPTPWSFEVHRAGGFDAPIEVSTSSRYLDLFDQNGLDPEPRAVTATPEEIIWEFDPPPGDTLAVSLDARLEPGAQWLGRVGETSVFRQGRPVVTARYKTWVTP